MKKVFFGMLVVALTGTVARAEIPEIAARHACEAQQNALAQAVIDAHKTGDGFGRPFFRAVDQFFDWSRHDGFGKCYADEKRKRGLQ